MGNMGQSGLGSNLMQMIMQRLAPLQQQNPQAFQQIMQHLQQRMSQMPQQAFGGNAQNAMGMGQGHPGGAPQGFPRLGGPPQGMPQLGGGQQGNLPPQALQALMARVAGRHSPLGG